MACLDCEIGKYSQAPGASNCSKCPSTQGSCVACTPGKILAFAAAASMSECSTCPLGWTKTPDLCTKCRKGTFSIAGSSKCSVCELNADSTAGSAACLCNAGFTRKGSSCSACETGTFKADLGDFSCGLCDADTYSSAIGSTSSLSCISCDQGFKSLPGSSRASACQAVVDGEYIIVFEIIIPYTDESFAPSIREQFKASIATVSSIGCTCQVLTEHVVITLVPSVSRRRQAQSMLQWGTNHFQGDRSSPFSDRKERHQVEVSLDPGTIDERHRLPMLVWTNFSSKKMSARALSPASVRGIQATSRGLRQSEAGITVNVRIFTPDQESGTRLIESTALTKSSLNRELEKAGVGPIISIIKKPEVQHIDGGSSPSNSSSVKGVAPADDTFPTLVLVISITAGTVLLLVVGVLWQRRKAYNSPSKKPSPGSQRGDPVGQEMLPGQMRPQYRAEMLLGAGGYGTVIKGYRLEESGMKKPVAIKVIFPCNKEAFSDDEISLLRRESITLSRVSSPFVVTLVEAITTRTEFVVVMDYLDGSSLQQLIDDARRRGNGPMTETEALGCCKDVLQGLLAIHTKGLVHRDIKPSNIMLIYHCSMDFHHLPSIEGRRAMKDRQYILIDLCIVAVTEASKPLASTIRRGTMRTVSDSVIGTGAYMSPEAFENKTRVSEVSDLWSLGVTLFQLLSGRLPFEGENNHFMAANILTKDVPSLKDLSMQPCNNTIAFSCSTGFSDLVKKAMCKNMQERFQSAAAMLETAEELSHLQMTNTIADVCQVIMIDDEEAQLAEGEQPSGNPGSLRDLQP